MSLPIYQRTLRRVVSTLTPTDSTADSAKVRVGTALVAVVTTAGDINMVFADGTNLILPLNAGVNQLAYEVTRVAVTGTTAVFRSLTNMV